MKNMGTVDRAVRAVIGVCLLIAAFTLAPLAAGWLHWIAIVIGVILILTAVISICPAYWPFGIRTDRSGNPA